MMTLEELKGYAKEYKIVPVARTVYADVRTPVEVLRILKHISSRCYLLESMEDAKRWGRTLSWLRPGNGSGLQG